MGRNSVHIERKRNHECIAASCLFCDIRIEGMAVSCEELVGLSDPIGEIVEGSTRPNGMKIEKVRVPMGVIGIIYEARPNVTVDGAILSLKAGSTIGTVFNL